MPNPDFRVEINYSPTPEIPLPLSLSAPEFVPLQTYTSDVSNPPEGVWNPEAGNSSPLACLPLDKPGGLWKLDIALFFTSTMLKLDAGCWKLEIAPNPEMARSNSPPEAGSWKLLSGLAPNAGSWKLEIEQQILDTR